MKYKLIKYISLMVGCLIIIGGIVTIVLNISMNIEHNIGVVFGGGIFIVLGYYLIKKFYLKG